VAQALRKHTPHFESLSAAPSEKMNCTGILHRVDPAVVSKSILNRIDPKKCALNVGLNFFSTTGLTCLLFRNINFSEVHPSSSEYRGTKMKGFQNRTGIFFLLCLLFLLPACLPNKKLTVGATATLLDEVARASSKQSDLRILREGMPAYLMLIDGMIQAWPDNEQLLIAGAQSYSSFASLFVEDQDKEYANLLYDRGKHYALRSLEMRGFKDPLERSFDDFKQGLNRLGKKDVSFLFWTATCWANWIHLNLDSMEAVSELPRVEWMMRRVLELDDGFYYGGPHLFMGIWFASRPTMAGGDLKKAREHFLKALDLGQGKFLMAYVYYAKYYARNMMDKELFTSILQKVLETPADTSPELILVNTVAKKQAKELLSHVEEYFE
jgi:hypothetical protein